MVTVTVITEFYDLAERKLRREGDRFEATEDRAAHIADVLPGYVSYGEAREEPEAPDYQSMTYQQLVELVRERGIKFKGRPAKAQLIKALTEE